MRKNSIKNTRINGEVQKVLSGVIRQEIKDPRIPLMTSVTDVEVAPDLKTCKAYIPADPVCTGYLDRVRCGNVPSYRGSKSERRKGRGAGYR